jgi:hypothetical protein
MVNYRADFAVADSVTGPYSGQGRKAQVLRSNGSRVRGLVAPRSSWGRTVKPGMFFITRGTRGCKSGSCIWIN